MLRGAAGDARHRRPVRLRMVGAMQQAQAQIDISRRLTVADRVALLQQGGEVGGEGLFAHIARRQHHPGKAGMGAKPRHAAARLGDAVIRIQRVQRPQQGMGRRQRAGRWRIKQRKRGRCRPPGRAVQREGGQLSLQNLRPVLQRQAAMQRLGPEPDCNTGFGSPGAAGALFRCRPADPLGGQPAQPGAGIKPRRAAKPAINDNPHARHGERCLGNRSCQHNFPAGRGRQRPVLLSRGQFAMQRQHLHIQPREAFGRAANLAPARQKGQHIARICPQRVADGIGHGLGQFPRISQFARAVGDGDGIGPPHALDHRRAQQRGKSRAIQRGAHRQQPQFRPQIALHIEAERDGDIGVEVALMRLVEEHRRHAIQPGVGLQAPHQQALGHHLHPHGGAGHTVEPGGQADALAQRLAQQFRHAPRGGAGGHAAWLQHQNFLPRSPGLIHQHQRHKGGFARTRGRDQHGRCAGAQRVEQRRQRLLHRQCGKDRHAAARGSNAPAA